MRYRPGEDDVRRIDWNVTARTGEPHVWRTRAEHELETWVLLDETPSMPFGTPCVGEARRRRRGRRRRRAAHRRPGQPARRRTPDRRRAALVAPLPAAGPRSAAAAADRPVRDRATATGAPGRDLGRGAAATSTRRHRARACASSCRLRRPRRRRSSGPFAWERALRRLAARHDVLVVEVVDPRELGCPTSGPWSWSTPRPAAAARCGPPPRSVTRTPRRPPPTAAPWPQPSGRRRRPPRAAHRPGLGARPVAAHVRGPAPPRPLPHAARSMTVVSLVAPWWLLPARAGRPARRRLPRAAARPQPYAVRFATLPMLERWCPRVPAGAGTCPPRLLFGFAAPRLRRRPPRDGGPVPARARDRDRRRRRLAVDAGHRRRPRPAHRRRRRRRPFIEDLPEGFNVGVVTFAGTTAVLAAPTDDRGSRRPP